MVIDDIKVDRTVLDSRILEMISLGITVYYLALSTEKMEGDNISCSHFKNVINPLVLM